MNKRHGFTLVELLIVMAIIVILAMLMVGIIDPTALVNKGRDAQRKKDLNRIKVAFEEYFNDKGTYPLDVGTWNIKANCNSTTIFESYLKPWPCDPSGNPYIILVENNKFRVITNLENKTDKDIPDSWYERTDINLYGLSKNNVNYGVSSSNILWYQLEIPSYCDKTSCYKKNVDTLTGCNHDADGCDYEHDGTNCYFRDGGYCSDRCQTTCCGPGCGY